ncbi:hypothetical protein OG272_21170 [Streptomyces sp. NBC_00104]|uniref:hypothetical protein n=1 Tax=Streptomyces sp. NBC_00104 TaxID=2903621 RepID=UPI0032487353
MHHVRPVGPSAILRAEGLGFAAQFVVGDDAVDDHCLGMYEAGAWIARAVPKPLLVITEAAETVIPANIQPAAYERALPPKKLVMLPGGHFDACAEGFTAPRRRGRRRWTGPSASATPTIDACARGA